jgi:hypothetical protein
MRTRLNMLIGIAGLAAASVASAQSVVYERPEPVIVTHPGAEVHEARVIASTAVDTGPQQHCWTEKRQIGPLELPGAIVGGLVDLFAGRQSTDYVQRCTTVSGTTAYWDVTYEFRGIEHHARLATPPGTTIAVNGYGEPIG